MLLRVKTKPRVQIEFWFDFLTCGRVNVIFSFLLGAFWPKFVETERPIKVVFYTSLPNGTAMRRWKCRLYIILIRQMARHEIPRKMNVHGLMDCFMAVCRYNQWQSVVAAEDTRDSGLLVSPVCPSYRYVNPYQSQFTSGWITDHTTPPLSLPFLVRQWLLQAWLTRDNHLSQIPINSTTWRLEAFFVFSRPY